MTRILASTTSVGLATALFAILTPGSAQAITVCTPVFTPPDVAPGSPISANLGTAFPCPSTPVTVTLNTVGSGPSSFQVGGVITTDAFGAGTNQFTRTSVTSVGIGSQGETGSGSFVQPITVSYSQPVVNPYLFFSFIDNLSEYRFTDPFTLLSANNATLGPLGDKVISSGQNNSDSGFVVQLSGIYSSFAFDYVNFSTTTTATAFTTGPSLVPGPLPVLGVGMAFSMSRKLRRRIKT